MIEGGVALQGYEDDDHVGRLGVPGFNSLTSASRVPVDRPAFIFYAFYAIDLPAQSDPVQTIACSETELKGSQESTNPKCGIYRRSQSTLLQFLMWYLNVLFIVRDHQK